MAQQILPPQTPVDNFFIGHMRSFNENTLHYLETLASLGDTVFRFGPFHAYFFNHPDAVHEFLLNTKVFQKPQTLRAALSDISALNVFNSDGDYWKRQRKLMQPAFHSKRIGSYADTMVEYAQREVKNWPDGAELDIDHLMTHVTMNIITKTMFDTEVGNKSNEIGEAMTELFQIVNHRTETIQLLPNWLPTGENRRVKELVRGIHSLLGGFIAERQKTEEDKGDLLSMLLMAQDEEGKGMTDEQIMNEALIIFGAGHETTANTLTFAWYALSQNPEVEAKLHAELDTVLAGRAPRLDDLSSLPYTEKIIKETLRLYPPAWGISRNIAEDIEIAGYKLPKGATAMVAPWTLGRDARWYENPLQFNPDRWTAEFEAQLPRYAYIPFGGGPRVCIGNQFAMMEARLILATIAQSYSLSLKKGFSTEPLRAFTLRPSNGMKMVAHIRELVPAL
jgi:cytochrome P450